MRVMTRATLKKITDAEKNGGVAPSPAKKAAGGGGKKRKAAAAEDDEEGTPTPAKKGKGGGKKKKADTPVEGELELPAWLFGLEFTEALTFVGR